MKSMTMTAFIMLVFAVVAFCLAEWVSGCTPAPLPPISADSGAAVCAHLAAIGCPQDPACPRVFDANQGVLTDFRPGCLLQAKSKSDALACGSVECPQ